jgi:U2 small nuclear ribonucleoprotein B''
MPDLAMKNTLAPRITPASYAPSQTLYISNIPSSKIQKEDLRRSLYILFSTYGPVIDVVALRTAKMRGQAHIVFRDIQTATLAMRALQGFEFFGKEMVGHLQCGHIWSFELINFS